ncbi:MAG TPA: aspartate/glutamate racemase family protein [Micromonospora sp.]
MPVFHARPGQVAYGYPIGILCAEWHIPFIPGDLNNAYTFDFPVRYLSVKGAAGANVLSGDDSHFVDLFVKAAQQLEQEGVRAITGNCGFMASYQQAVADSVRVPVFMSSLLQVPMLVRMLSADHKLAVLVANGPSITDELLAAVGITEVDRVVFQGLDHQPHWNDVILKETGVLDSDRIRAEVVETALDLLKREPSIGAFMLECSDLPPYSAAIHEATGLPVFDWAGFIRYVHDAVVPRTYSGLF